RAHEMRSLLPSLLLGLLGICGCHRGRAVTPSSGGDAVVPLTSDVILHGNVSVTGTGFSQRLTLMTGGGPRRLHASPADSAALVRVAGPGIELSVHGVDERGDLRVQRFSAVR